MKPRLKGQILRKVSEYDGTDNCRICGKPITKGQEIEILVEEEAALIPRTTSAFHAGECMNAALAWWNTYAECAEDLGVTEQAYDCAVKKSEEEHDPTGKRKNRKS